MDRSRTIQRKRTDEREPEAGQAALFAEPAQHASPPPTAPHIDYLAPAPLERDADALAEEPAPPTGLLALDAGLSTDDAEANPWAGRPLFQARRTLDEAPAPEAAPALQLAAASTPVVQRQAAEAPAQRTDAQIETLIDQALRAVAQHETGGRAVESRMDTSAGVRASYASQVQATTEWSITALRRLDAQTLDDQFDLTRAELNTADTRARNAGSLWDATRTSQAPDAATFLADQRNQQLLASSGLDEAALDDMLAFQRLRTEITAAYTQRTQELQALQPQELWERAQPNDRSRAGVRRVGDLTGQRVAALAQRVARREVSEEYAAAQPASDLGIDASSLDAYLRGNWREDRAAWVRRAVESLPAAQEGQATIGERIGAAATAGEGLDLGRHEIGRLVRQHLQQTPAASDEDVVRAVASRHNPGAGAAYVNSVLGHFREIQQAENAAPAAPQ